MKAGEKKAFLAKKAQRKKVNMKRKERSDWKQKEIENENKELTDLLFGNAMKEFEEEEEETQLWDAINEEGDEIKEGKPKKKKQKENEKQQVWEDSDEEEEINLVGNARTVKLRKKEGEMLVKGKDYEERLRSHFAATQVQSSDWAKVSQEEEEKDEEEEFEDILRSAKSHLKTKSNKLQGGLLGFSQLRDVNSSERNNCSSRIVKFHPNGSILLTGGLDKTIRLFQVDGNHNTKLQSVYIKDLPIYSANYLKNGEEIICTGKKPYFYIYDLIGGEVYKNPGLRGRRNESLEKFAVSKDGEYIAFALKKGTIILVSGKSKQWIGELQMNEYISSLCFSNDSKYLYSMGVTGEVFKWDVAQQKCVHRFFDDGCVSSSTITVSPLDNYFAIGSKSGVVNLYDMNEVNTSPSPKPLREFLNITTDINLVKFNHDSNILAFSSFEKQNLFRMIHVPTRTVFENFPRVKERLSHVSDFDFSPNSGFFAVGNDHGRVLLYRLNHYENA